jgi:aerobic carbon-monoxide dehydrogenase large subunit
VTVMTGEATRLAASAVRDKALAAAAELLQAPVSVLDVVDGEVVRTDATSGPSISLGALAQAMMPKANGRPSGDGGLSADGCFQSSHMNYPYGVHIAVTRIDRATGGVAIERYLVAYDVGKAVNPMLIEGQIAGGCAQGIGGTLLEEFLYDERGEPLSVTLADYLMPTAREIPAIDVLICEDAPSPLNPLGLKGAGEGGANAVGAVLAAAIDDALGLPNAVTELPITPQRLKRLIAKLN